MPTIVNNIQAFSLLEVTRSIQKTLSERYQTAFWVKAEMNKLNHYSHSGHCFPELVEKVEGRVVAEIKSNLWKHDYVRINKRFIEILSEPLKDGIKILFLANVSFDPVYGLSLRIIDIDPSYTLGDLEKEKQHTIHRLKTEGIFHLNKSLPLAILPQRIAIISVETSKGYADFVNVLDSNNWNYAFFYMLFPSLLQGDKAVKSIKNQLHRITKVKDHFDVVAIIRGGGGDVGLSCFNDYALSKEIAEFPLPVLTGIGHATNETVVEMISYTNQITPTKMAEYLLQTFHNFSIPVVKAQEVIVSEVKQIIEDKQLSLENEVKYFRSVTENVLNRNRSQLENQAVSLLQFTRFLFGGKKELFKTMLNTIKKETAYVLKHTKHEVTSTTHQLKRLLNLNFQRLSLDLNHMDKNIQNMSPEKVLQRGYSISFINGKSVKSVNQLKVGDVMETQLHEGRIISKIDTLNENKK